MSSDSCCLHPGSSDLDVEERDHVLDNVEVCSHELRFAITRMLDAMADNIVESLL